MKKSLQKTGCLVSLLLLSIMVSGQTDLINDQIERLAETMETDQDITAFCEDIADMARHPVPVNSAGDEADLGTIPFLTPKLRKDLMTYITLFGDILSGYELLAIPGFDSSLVMKIAPFVTFTPSSHLPAPTPGNLFRYGHHDLMLRYAQSFPESEGYKPGDSITGDPGPYYKGNPQRYYFRYEYSWFDKLRIGLAGEKDPGEQFFRGRQSWGMDYYSSFLSLTNIGILKNLITGNFRASFGQGLTMGSGFSPGSAPGFSLNGPASRGIRPDLGMSEGNCLRGVAATFRKKPVEVSCFISYHRRDATSSAFDSITGLAGAISSFVTTGYHRTNQEISKMNMVKELVAGGNVSFSLAPGQRFGFKIGLTGVFQYFSASVMPKVYPYSQFGFRGKENYNMGIDYQVRIRGIYLFGEVSRSWNAGMALIAGVSAAPDSRVSFTAIYRDYQPAYQGLLANAFGQNSSNANERGIYMAIQAVIHPKLCLSAYTDLFTFPWLKYRIDLPAGGQESGTMLTWQASRNVNAVFRFYQKNTRVNSVTDRSTIIHKLTDQVAWNYRLTIGWAPEEQLHLATRIEVKEVKTTTGKVTPGYFISQDASVNNKNWLSNVTCRFALFDIPTYDERIYTFEPEVQFGYSVPAFQGRGLRVCSVVKLRILKNSEFWLRGGLTWYADRNSVGTGPDMTEGNVRGELTGQVMVHF